MDKIQEICKNEIENLQEYITNSNDFFLQGDFEEFERGLSKLLNEVHDSICVAKLNDAMESTDFKEVIKEYAACDGVIKLSKRQVQVQFKTGSKRTIWSYYGKQSKGQASIDRHVGLSYLGFIKKASPMYVSSSSITSVLCPSFSIGQQLMEEMGINGSYNRIRDLSIELGQKVVSQGIRSIIGQDESMLGKRVVVMIDGGRSRTRLENGYYTTLGYPKFETDWREVKLLAILVLDENGKIERKELPLYDISVNNIEEAMAKLTEALILLNVSAAKEVQFISDGAACFWKRIEQTFEAANVAHDKITYSLDYYHAVEHLSDLVNEMANDTVNEKERKSLFTELKSSLWQGDIEVLLTRVKTFCKVKGKEIKDKLLTEINYFEKHKNRMRYQFFRSRKWLCGSGAVESAIRRIINLRFKAPASFWLIEHLEPLCFLRATFLAGRWKILLQNLKFRGDNF